MGSPAPRDAAAPRIFRPALATCGILHGLLARRRTPMFASRVLLLLTVALLGVARGSDEFATPAVTGWECRWDGPGETWRPCEALGSHAGRRGTEALHLRATLPDGAWRDPALFLGQVDGRLEVLVDGVTLGPDALSGGGRSETRPLEATWAIVQLPDHAHALELHLAGSGEPSIGRAVKIGARADLLRALQSDGLLGFVLVIIALGVGITALIAWILRNHRGHLHFGLSTVLISAAAVAMSSQQPLLADAPRFWHALIVAALAVVGPATLLFLHHELVAGLGGEGVSWPMRVGRPLYVVLPALGVAAVALPGDAARPLTWLLAAAALGSLLVAAAFAWGAARRGDPSGRLILVAVLLLAACAVHDIVGRPFAVGLDDPRLVPFGVFAWGQILLTTAQRGVMGRGAAAQAARLQSADEMRQALVGRVQVATRQLSETVRALSLSSAAQAEVIQRQAVALQEAQVTSAELGQTAHRAAEQARTVLDAAGKAEAAGTEGGLAVERSLGNLGQIREVSAGMSERLSRLGRRARELESVVSTVKTLADQTNLLAVNAALEAVRSGEAGKGFAVVAREIRSLADRAVRGTGEMRQNLGRLAEELGEAEALGTNGGRIVEASVSEVRASGASLSQLSETVRDTSGVARQIAATVSQQSAGMAQMAVTVQELNAQMQELLARVAETENVAEALRAVVAEIETVVPAREDFVAQATAAARIKVAND